MPLDAVRAAEEASEAAPVTAARLNRLPEGGARFAPPGGQWCVGFAAAALPAA